MKYYVYTTLEEANAALVNINNFLPVIGLKNGVPAPLSAKTVEWISEPSLMLSGEYAIPRIPQERLDDAGELIQVDDVWVYSGIPVQERIDFMAAHGQGLRELTRDDFPSIEED